MNWISVKDQLPEINQYRESFIVYGSPQCGNHCCHFQVMESYFTREGVWEFGEYDCQIEVTHWMPLPKPPQE
jgi:hypothetical protein